MCGSGSENSELCINFLFSTYLTTDRDEASKIICGESFATLCPSPPYLQVAQPAAMVWDLGMFPKLDTPKILLEIDLYYWRDFDETTNCMICLRILMFDLYPPGNWHILTVGKGNSSSQPPLEGICEFSGGIFCSRGSMCYVTSNQQNVTWKAPSWNPAHRVPLVFAPMEGMLHSPYSDHQNTGCLLKCSGMLYCKTINLQ